MGLDWSDLPHRIRNRQVNGSSPFVGSRFFNNLAISSPKPAAQLLNKPVFSSSRVIAPAIEFNAVLFLSEI
ncbi:MAG: hypothetical protein DMG97_12035 [Acidobacteria bacterium]|nr:MAG: hypothetical protein DMG98_14455 [Acidobacteriota bacterium]PYV69950.1 MAG: hypothetical protein DMG96_32590 [Acidobacteriota bacterium]PYV73071.1 MAG: hypothetical protein DMG97_12035 [Acidobacteriota bacterium]